MARPEKVRIGNLLVQEKLISQEQLTLALEQQKQSGRKLGRVLIENGYATEDGISATLAKQLKIPYLNLKHYNINVQVARVLPEMLARRFRALLLEDKCNTYLVAMGDPTDLFAYDEIARSLKRDIELVLVNESQVLETIDRIYRRTEQITNLARELGADMAEAVDFGALKVEPGAEDAPVVKLLQTMFEDATQVNASDVHIEPQESLLQIRFRIDGMLQLQTESDSKIAPALVQRVKLMSGLDISEKRLPQDGRFNVRIRDTRVDVRISTMPTQYGESVAMRLLNRSTGVQGLNGLGMPPQLLARLQQIIRRSTGMVLVTGPTGSGKTTTLYAALNEVNTIDKKIITVEDPIEYRLAGLNQVQVNEKIDLTFGRVLRSTLRQDPDIILVGEMRDPETAQIGLRAALTGHMVFSTLHTRDAASTPMPDRHGGAALHGCVFAAGGDRAAAGAGELRKLRRAVSAVGAGNAVAAGQRARRRQTGANDARARLPVLPPHRLCRAHRGIRNAGNGRRAHGGGESGGHERIFATGGQAHGGQEHAPSCDTTGV